MTRTLLLMRHGTAAPPSGMHDRERPLTNRGRGQSLRAGDRFRERGLRPDRIVLSSAERAQQTWEAFRLGLTGGVDEAAETTDSVDGAGPDIWAMDVYAETDSRVYDNTVDDLLDVIRETPDDLDTVLVIGHNPSIAGLASVLDEDPDNLVRAELVQGYPTATVAVFTIERPWSELREGGGHLTEVVARRT